jgi:hypothetical protein
MKSLPETLNRHLLAAVNFLTGKEMPLFSHSNVYANNLCLYFSVGQLEQKTTGQLFDWKLRQNRTLC